MTTWALLKADLQSLANARRVRGGAALLLATAFYQAFAFLLAFAPSMSVYSYPPLQELLRGPQAGPALETLLQQVLAPSWLIASLVALGSGRRLLFGGAEAELLLRAPVSALALLSRTAWKTLFTVLLWSFPLCLGLALPLYAAAELPWFLLALLPLAAAWAVLPIVAVVLLGHVALTRWLAHPRIKAWYALFTRVLYLAVVVLFVAGSGEVGDNSERTASWLAAGAAGPAPAVPLLAAPARLLAGGFPGVPVAWRELVWSLLLSGAALAAAAPLLRRAAEYESLAAEPWRLRRGARGLSSWPAGVRASLWRKDLAALLQQPGAALGLLFSAVVLLVLMARTDLGGMDRTLFHGGGHPFADPLEEVLRGAVGLLAVWFWVLCMVLPGQLMGFVAAEARQWDLLVGCPAERRAILQGKLRGYFLVTGLYVLCSVISGRFVKEISWPGIALFLALVPPVLYATLYQGIALITMPFLFRPPAAGAPAPALRSALALVLILLSLAVTWLLGVLLWAGVRLLLAAGELGDSPDGWRAALVLAAFWLVGCAWGGLWSVLARRNFERLLAPAA